MSAPVKCVRISQDSTILLDGIVFCSVVLVVDGGEGGLFELR